MVIVATIRKENYENKNLYHFINNIAIILLHVRNNVSK